MATSGFQDLDVWRVSMQMVKEIYIATRALPKDEMYGITSQVRRAAVSIPANIAEGYARNASKEYLQFVGIAAGSQAELTTLLILVKELYDIPSIDSLLDLNKRVGSMLWNLKLALRNKLSNP
ncbi:MAG: four helix bundle protein [Fimbriimonadaceae bacterium]|nr:four helix bundle protein [Fimbriimonadaceae bacterium]